MTDDIISISKYKTNVIEDIVQDLEIESETTTTILENPSSNLLIHSINTDTEIFRDPSMSVIELDMRSESICIEEKCTNGSGNNQGSAIVGALFISDVTPDTTGIVALKSWEIGDVPTESDVKACTTDNDNVRVHVWAEGGIGDFTPTIIVDGNTVTNINQHPSGVRIFEGYAVTTVTESRIITAVSDTGATDSVFINRGPAGPTVSDISFGLYPGTQTELKAGDVITIFVTVDDTTTSVNVKAVGANDSLTSITNFVDNGNGTYTFSDAITVSGASGAQTVTASGVNSLGTEGDDFVSTGTLNLNQTYPSIDLVSVVYPNSQSAIKDFETADVTATVTDFDTISYTTSGDISHQSDTSTYAPTKTVTRVGGSYIVSGTNYTITATRTANNATTSSNALVRIVNVAPTANIAIDGSPSRLRSIDSYTVRLTTDQLLSDAPTLDADLGDFTGVFSGSNSIYTKTLTIQDSTVRGTGTFTNLSVIGLSGISGSVINSGNTYTVGGFTNRTITFDPFATHMPIGTSVATFSKVRARYTGTVPWLSRETAKDFLVDGFTIVDSNGDINQNGNYIWLTDTSLSGANSTGSLKVDIEEIL